MFKKNNRLGIINSKNLHRKRFQQSFKCDETFTLNFGQNTVHQNYGININMLFLFTVKTSAMEGCKAKSKHCSIGVVVAEGKNENEHT